MDPFQLSQGILQKIVVETTNPFEYPGIEDKSIFEKIKQTWLQNMEREGLSLQNCAGQGVANAEGTSSEKSGLVLDIIRENKLDFAALEAIAFEMSLDLEGVKTKRDMISRFVEHCLTDLCISELVGAISSYLKIATEEVHGITKAPAVTTSSSGVVQSRSRSNFYVSTVTKSQLMKIKKPALKELAVSCGISVFGLKHKSEIVKTIMQAKGMEAINITEQYAKINPCSKLVSELNSTINLDTSADSSQGETIGEEDDIETGVDIDLSTGPSIIGQYLNIKRDKSRMTRVCIVDAIYADPSTGKQMVIGKMDVQYNYDIMPDTHISQSSVIFR